MNETEENIPRELRTPEIYVALSLHQAMGFWLEFMEEQKSINSWLEDGELPDVEQLFWEMLGDALDNPDVDGDKGIEDAKIGDGSNGFLVLMEAIIDYSVQAMRAEKNGQRDKAWSFATDAYYWSGILSLGWKERNGNQNAGAQLARRRHAENYSLMAHAINYWARNIDPSLSAEKAADELVKIVPLSHKKLAEYVSKAKKGNL